MDHIKGKDQALVTEFWPEPDKLCARGPEGRFVSELVIPFAKNASSSRFKHRNPVKLSAGFSRYFVPGSDWLYVKLYTGKGTADRILRELGTSVIRPLQSSRVIDRWFFIRYVDPHWHLRLRFFTSNQSNANEVAKVFKELAVRLMNSGLVWRYATDTYDREVERYGGEEGVQLAEEVSCADSEAVLQLIEYFLGESGEDLRWRVSLSSVDFFLDSFGLDLTSKSQLVEAIRDGFGKEFGSDSVLRRQLGDKYRRERPRIHAALSFKDDDISFNKCVEILSERSLAMSESVKKMRIAESQGRLTRSVGEILQSHIHMHLNRLFRSSQRAQEYVVYDLLGRFYSSQLAQGKAGSERGKISILL